MPTPSSLQGGNEKHGGKWRSGHTRRTEEETKLFGGALIRRASRAPRFHQRLTRKQTEGHLVVTETRQLSGGPTAEVSFDPLRHGYEEYFESISDSITFILCFLNSWIDAGDGRQIFISYCFLFQ